MANSIQFIYLIIKKLAKLPIIIVCVKVMNNIVKTEIKQKFNRAYNKEVKMFKDSFIKGGKEGNLN